MGEAYRTVNVPIHKFWWPLILFLWGYLFILFDLVESRNQPNKNTMTTTTTIPLQHFTRSRRVCVCVCGFFRDAFITQLSYDYLGSSTNDQHHHNSLKMMIIACGGSRNNTKTILVEDKLTILSHCFSLYLGSQSLVWRVVQDVVYSIFRCWKRQFQLDSCGLLNKHGH